MRPISRFVIAIGVCLLVGYLSGFATQSSISTWYPTLVKPSFNPPNWIFAPVWSVLYLLMGISFGLILNQTLDVKVKRQAILFFIGQLFLNALWSVLFFGFQMPFLALIEILILWFFIFKTIKIFAPLHALASKLLWPYLAWVSFAMVLNATLWWLNR
jgi:translocator protein